MTKGKGGRTVLLAVAALVLAPLPPVSARESALVPHDLGDTRKKDTPGGVLRDLMSEAVQSLREIERQMSELEQVRAAIDRARSRYLREPTPENEAALGKAVAEGAARGRAAAEKTASMLEATANALEKARSHVRSQRERVLRSSRELQETARKFEDAIRQTRKAVAQIRAQYGAALEDPDNLDPEVLRYLEKLRLRYEEARQAAAVYKRAAQQQEWLLGDLDVIERQLAFRHDSAKRAAERYSSSARNMARAGHAMQVTLQTLHLRHSYREAETLQRGLDDVLGKLGRVEPRAEDFSLPIRAENGALLKDVEGDERRARADTLIEWIEQMVREGRDSEPEGAE